MNITNAFRDMQIGLIVGQTVQVALEFATGTENQRGSQVIIDMFGKILSPINPAFGTADQIANAIKNTSLGATLDGVGIDVTQPLLNGAFMASGFAVGKLLPFVLPSVNKPGYIPVIGVKLTTKEWGSALVATNIWNITEGPLIKQVPAISEVASLALPIEAIAITVASRYLI